VESITREEQLKILSNIEEELRQGFKNVLIVPTLAEWNP
jgi:hypothetical protein